MTLRHTSQALWQYSYNIAPPWWFSLVLQAAHYFNIKLVHVPVDEKTRKVNIKVRSGIYKS